MKTNTQRGSAALWIIVAVIIVLATGGYLYMKSNQPQNAPEQSGTIATPSTSSVTCDQVFPLDVLQHAFSVVSFSKSANTITPPNAEDAAAWPLVCSYDDLSIQPKPSPFPFYVGMVTLPDGGAPSDNPYTIKSQYTGAVNAQKPGLYNLPCVASTIGTQSTECVGPVASNGDQQTSAIIVFIASNNKFVATVSLLGTGSNIKQVVEQMAKEVDSKLSSY